MLEISNRTPFNTALIPGMDKKGHDYAAVVIKGTFDIAFNIHDINTSLPIAELQVPLVLSDEYYGKPGASSIKQASDAVLIKTGTDVVLTGHAYAPKGPVKTLDVSLRVGALAKTIRVYGDRYWEKSFMSWKPTEPAPFERLPLIYENAFGSRETTPPDPERPEYEKRNPVGKGFSTPGRKTHLEGLALPNLEDPDNPIKSWKDKPIPQGFGCIAPNWSPRIEYAGTYDEDWVRQRMPLLPMDFDNRYFNAAHPDLVVNPHLKGGEPVRIANACDHGPLSFVLPKRTLEVTACIRGKDNTFYAVLDTVLIAPDESRVMLTWRAIIPCFRSFLYIDSVKITEQH